MKMNDQIREEIDEHLKGLMEIAQINDLPFVFVMAVGENEEGTEYRKELLSPQILGIKLKNDTIRKHELVEAGFDVIPPRENITINMEEIFNG